LRSRGTLAAIAFCLLARSPIPATAQIDHPAFAPILSAAESLFQTMKTRDYPATWRVLTTKSRETIVSETYDAVRNAGDPPVPKDRIRDDFAGGGPLCRQYWEGFLRRFNPDDALEKSRWEMGMVGKDRAEVLITRQGADRPAVLEMFLEAGGWRAGLVETFWSR
jgi:hypothetical protein